MRIQGLLFCIFAFFIYHSSVSAESPVPLTWSDCLRIAVSNNLGLQQATLSLTEADANLWSARSAYFPQLSAGWGYSFSKNVSKGLESSSDGTSLNLSGRQVIFDGGSTILSIRKSEIQKGLARLNVESVSSSVLLELRNAWAEHAKAKQSLVLLQEILVIRQEQYQTVKLKYESGRENKGAVKSSEAEVANAENEVRIARRNVESTRSVLASILLLPFSSVEITDQSYPEQSDIPGQPDFAPLVTNSLAFAQQKFQEELARLDLKTANAKLLPQLAMDGGMGFSGPGFEDRRYSFGLNIGLPLLEGGGTLARIKGAKTAYASALLRTREVREEIFQSLRTAWESYEDARSRFDVRRMALEAAQERAKIADVQYATGLINYDVWMTIQDNLVNSEKVFLETRFQIIKAEAAWLAAKGDSFE